jgi:2-keto-4-pentenoate hydratase
MADMQMNDGLIVGPALHGWSGTDFTCEPVRLTAGDDVQISATIELPGGSALASLALCLDHLADHCGGPQAGQIVITGSLSGLSYFPAGTRIVGEIGDLGCVSCQLID